MLLPHLCSVSPNNHHLPRYEFAAGLERAFRGVFYTDAARHLHTHDRKVFYIVKTDNLCIIHHVQLRTSDEGDSSGYEEWMRMRLLFQEIVKDFGVFGLLSILYGIIDFLNPATVFQSPVGAISFIAIVGFIYLVFCGIQVYHLFLGRGNLP